jgi:hypothetical protein|tara:strand:- start:215 stop:592 length:378 start_codon:yes stop_codon:yes gene_type:complete
MITSTLVTSTDVTVPTKVFTSSTTGAAIGGAVTGQTNAVTTIALCNTGTVDLTDETSNSVNVTIHFVKSGSSASAANTIVSNLIVPAGETVFFSDEKMILDSGDEIWVGTSTGNLIAITVSTLPV